MKSSSIPINYEYLHEGWNVTQGLYRDSIDCSVQELLEKTLIHIQSLKWLNIESRGAILLKASNEELVISAHSGMPEQRISFCERATLDRCACRNAIQNKTISFTYCNGGYNNDLDNLKQNEKHFILPLINQGVIFGVATIFVPPDHQPDATEIEMMQKLADILSAIISRLQMEEILAVKQLEVQESQETTIHQLGKAAEFRDNETGMHILRMSHYAGAIAKAIGIPSKKRDLLTVAAPMHDVGKIGIPDSILLKPARLTDEEFEKMKHHTFIGSKILEGSDELMRTAREIAISHHEKWDGSGYPEGTKGEEISLFGRICCLADVFDALTSKRPYKDAWPVQKAIDTIKKHSGRAFDPRLVSAFLEVLPEILRIKNLFRDEIIDPSEKLFLPSLPKCEDEWIPWDDTFCVGIDAIDVHHRYLFSLTNALHKTILHKQQANKVASVLSALRQYTIIHFKEEERMMRHYNYPDLHNQVTQHKLFIQKLSEFKEMIYKTPLTIGLEIAYYLRDWLINHIQKEDKQLETLC
jgi:cyclic di-GMP phosphodiesterase